MWRSLVAPNRYKVIIRTLTQQTSHERTRKENFFLDATWQPVEKTLPWGTFWLQCCHCVLFFHKFLLTEEQRPGSGPKDKVRDVWYLYVFFFLQWRLSKTSDVWLALAKLSQVLVFFLGTAEVKRFLLVHFYHIQTRTGMSGSRLYN